MRFPPHVDLGAGGTPLQEAPRLSAALGGPRVLIKRDDLTPLAMGGNKLRKLEYLLAHALAGDADAVITTGAHTSNHCRLTAAACARLGLEAHLVLRVPDGAAPPVQGNLLLDRLLGAHIHAVAAADPAGTTGAVLALAAELRAAGRRPYVIPTGGSVGRGALGYARAAEELAAQAAALGAEPAAVVTATGSGGTHAGLLAGRRVHGAGWQAVGVLVGGEDPAEFAAETMRVLREAEGLLGLGPALPEAWGLTGLAAPPPGRAEAAAGPGALRAAGGDLLSGYVGAGYGDITPGVREALALAARTEGLILDPVYTGKAMAGLIGEIRAGRWDADDTVVFLHTGGQPGLFSRAGEVLAG